MHEPNSWRSCDFHYSTRERVSLNGKSLKQVRSSVCLPAVLALWWRHLSPFQNGPVDYSFMFHKILVAWSNEFEFLLCWCIMYKSRHTILCRGPFPVRVWTEFQSSNKWFENTGTSSFFVSECTIHEVMAGIYTFSDCPPNFCQRFRERKKLSYNKDLQLQFHKLNSPNPVDFIVATNDYKFSNSLHHMIHVHVLFKLNATFPLEILTWTCQKGVVLWNTRSYN